MNGRGLLADYYAFTMAQALFACGKHTRETCFEIFFRRVPDGGRYVIASGLAQAFEHIASFGFDAEELAALREMGPFSDAFLHYLSEIRFTGDVYALPEGTPVLPGEPMMSVTAPAAQALLLETALLLLLNHQSLIATKAHRMVRAAAGRPVWELGARRAQGEQGALLGARAAFIGGCSGTSCTLAAHRFGIPCIGTMAHAWVQMFDDEYEAFCTFCRQYPHGTTLLVDTYDTLGSGIPNAIRAFQQVLIPMGGRQFAIRLDSGDPAVLVPAARRQLDEAGLERCRIVLSDRLDEYRIAGLLQAGIPVDAFGVGERLITAASDPVLGGVCKLVALRGEDGAFSPRSKYADNLFKRTVPHRKRLWRFYDQNGMPHGDLLTGWEESPPSIPDCIATELLVPVFRQGKTVCTLPALQQVRANCAGQTACFDTAEHLCGVAYSGQLQQAAGQSVPVKHAPGKK